MPDPATPPEQWLPVPGYDGYYLVSDHGHVKSLRDRTCGKRGGLLTQHRRTGGYFAVTLVLNGRERQRSVHSLVLEAFVGPCPEGQEPRHGPGGQDDNRLVNLSYGTHRENMADKRRDGTWQGEENNAAAKLTRAAVLEIRSRVGAGEIRKALAREFGVCPTTITDIARRRTWREV